MSNDQRNNFWIDAIAAVESARSGIIGCGLERNPKVANALESGQPGTPLLVERLDKPNNAYYLVPWVATEGVVFVVMVDASSGNMLAVTMFPKPISSPFISSAEALNYAARKFPEHIFSEPKLVWQPCQESTTPTRPFYQIIFDKSLMYVDMDGSIFLTLTPLGLGGTL